MPDVERNPEIVSGAWVVRGTRSPAPAAIDDAEDGYTAEEIVAKIDPTLPLEPASRIIAFATIGNHKLPCGDALSAPTPPIVLSERVF
jgi:uncharacterized protein (DUF433 family)